jgi:hypothetical protein
MVLSKQMGMPVKTPPPFNWHSDLCKKRFADSLRSVVYLGVSPFPPCGSRKAYTDVPLRSFLLKKKFVGFNFFGSRS